MTTLSSDCSEQIRQKSEIPRSYLEVLTIGIEPTTYWLQNNCSSNWAKSACGVSECGSFRGNENWKHSDTSVTGTIGSLNQTQNIGLTRRTYSPSVRNRNRTCITVRRLSTCHPQPAWPYRKWIRTTRTERLLPYQGNWHTWDWKRFITSPVGLLSLQRSE